jgi:hypothetical protein
VGLSDPQSHCFGESTLLAGVSEDADLAAAATADQRAAVRLLAGVEPVLGPDGDTRADGGRRAERVEYDLVHRAMVLR